MKEIEVKAHLKDREVVIEKLKTLGCVLGEPVKQIDIVYAKITGTVAEYLQNDHFVRIRETNNGKFIFTVKQPMKQALSKLEFETEVSNKDQLHQALLLMGYSVANKVEKVRHTAHHGVYEICLDDVTDLGAFIEVEKFSEEDPDMVRKELFDFLITLGVSKDDEVNVGYDILAIEKGI